jgi:hypothetical protein
MWLHQHLALLNIVFLYRYKNTIMKKMKLALNLYVTNWGIHLYKIKNT